MNSQNPLFHIFFLNNAGIFIKFIKCYDEIFLRYLSQEKISKFMGKNKITEGLLSYVKMYASKTYSKASIL